MWTVKFVAAQEKTNTYQPKKIPSGDDSSNLEDHIFILVNLSDTHVKDIVDQTSRMDQRETQGKQKRISKKETYSFTFCLKIPNPKEI